MAKQEPQPPSGEPTSTGHNYDGIQEYDNPTPLWWDLLFVGSILFAPFYVVWFHSPFAERTITQKYEVALAANLKRQFGEIGTLEPDEATITKYMTDKKWLAVGKSTYASKCAQCHGKKGEGINGVNLTDEYYKNINQITDIAQVILNGANGNSMPAWKNKLHPNEVVLVSSYVASLRGQDLPGRQAEGKEIPPWPDTPLAGSSESSETPSE